MITASISVVIPTFKRPELLHKCLAALYRQRYPGCFFEVMVVSDGPDPETEKLGQAFAQGHPDFCIAFHSLPARRGPAAARNYGWHRTSGDLVIFTDDDCIPDAGWLAAYWRAYRLYDQDYIAFTGHVMVPVRERPTDYEKNVAHLSTAEFITANCACSRAVLDLTGGFDEAFPAAWREDSDFQFELLKNKVPIAHVGDAVICHPVRPAHWGISIGEQRKSMFNALLFKKHPDLYRSRIARGPVWNYYVIILATVVTIVSFAFGSPETGVPALLIWLCAVMFFVAKRLKGTDASFSHRLEMMVTSLAIPYLSVYWTIRGALRYKVFFL
ncbi:glycosyltransferase family 2 protein [Dyadobacter sp. CY261]|uniref:glycosyltransferase family 2 protein n=1 Tax=Dyadobacter sp. CY261 TaxID=2907203 RepID=UPI001F216887|nr:glycosyltransferase [Dyadobacter sp. CY261]MCF0069622.1 glycosyltransferase family 2 protein [Dyadobacter sp. CY261]